MNTRELYDALIGAEKAEQVEAALSKYRKDHGDTVNEVPFGGRQNNRGEIEVAADPGRSLIERVTNAHDAVLEFEHLRHDGKPSCRSPREAANAWLGVPAKDGLAGLTVKQRQDLAACAVVRLEPGEGWQSRVLTIIDHGIGIAPNRMKSTILSLGASNKIQKHYLAGTYGQGGSSTFAFCNYSVIASRAYNTNEIAFTVVRYLDLPAEEYKTGHYVYLVEHNEPLVVQAKGSDLKHGTIVRHFGYDLTGYSSTIGPKSIYGVLQRVMFDPVAPVRFENKVHDWNRVIKGARNALNGAVDQGDDSARGPELDYHLPMFNVSLGDHGSIGIEYWVLARPPEEKGKARKNPVDAFVDSRRPIVMTHNGQNQDERSVSLIRRDADLPFLRNRVICHVNCDHLTPTAKRLLFSSTREQSREGYVQKMIEKELVSLLKSDDELRRLNEEAREQSLKEQDDATEQQMRRQVAKLLRIAGAALVEAAGPGKKKGPDDVNPKPPRKPRPKPEPIVSREPPTYIKIVGDEDEDVTFYAGQRRYVRIETDANSNYHDPDDPKKSRINIAVGDDLKVVGTSPLSGGRMRVGIECGSTVVVGSKGSIRIELYRPGLSALSDERGYAIVKAPPPKEADQKAAFPDFRVIPVAGPDEADWDYVCDSTGETDVARHASGAVMNDGVLYVYYSEVFPRFATERRRLEQQNPALIKSFQKRYELWLAVHALLVYQEHDGIESDDDAIKEVERQERCRLATIASMVADQEVKSGVLIEEAETAA